MLSPNAAKSSNRMARPSFNGSRLSTIGISRIQVWIRVLLPRNGSLSSHLHLRHGELHLPWNGSRDHW